MCILKEGKDILVKCIHGMVGGLFVVFNLKMEEGNRFHFGVSRIKMFLFNTSFCYARTILLRNGANAAQSNKSSHFSGVSSERLVS